jgi:hypothetical protein
MGLTVLLGFVAMIVSSCHLAQSVEKRTMNVIFQSGVMVHHPTVQRMCMCRRDSLARAMATVMRRDVITMISSAGRLLALMPGVHLRVAIWK